jgi:hypothetical protein
MCIGETLIGESLMGETLIGETLTPTVLVLFSMEGDLLVEKDWKALGTDTEGGAIGALSCSQVRSHTCKCTGRGVGHLNS